MMKAFCAATAITVGSGGTSLAAEPVPVQNRYLIERTFPAGVLDGIDEATKRKVNDNNASVQVNWEKSYVNDDKTRTYCIYNGPSEEAVREAARLNGLPVDSIVEIPLGHEPEPIGAVHKLAAGSQRYLVTRRGDVAFHDINDEKSGVRLITSYLAPDRRSSYSIYQAPDFSSVERAAKASGSSFESIVEVPETLYPR